jgi:hypothetical protein
MIFAGDVVDEAERQELRNQHWTLRTERWRYIRYRDGSEELYDHDSDPHEWVNLAADPGHAGRKRRLAEQLRAMIGGF